MKRVLSLLNLNILLAVAAVLLTVSSQIQLGMKPRLQPFLILIFLATFFVYNRHLLIAAVARKKRMKLNYFVLLVLAAGFVASAVFTKTEVLIALLAMGVLTVFYSFPSPRINKSFFKLREIPYLKIFLITLVWSAATILLPVINEGSQIFSPPVIFLLAARLFFIFAIAIQFDIRDMQTDHDSGLKTIPLLINRDNSVALSYLSLLFSLLISLFQYKIQNKWFITEALCISLVTTFWFLKFQFFEKRGQLYYHVLDGALLLQGLLVVGFYLLNQYN